MNVAFKSRHHQFSNMRKLVLLLGSLLLVVILSSPYIAGQDGETVTVTGRTVDEYGNPIPSVGVRAGYPPPTETPWVIGTYHTNMYTDPDGEFSFETTETIVPEIKFIKLGYGNLSEQVGSIGRFTDVNLSQGQGATYDFGNITLHQRTPIQASARPNSTYWPFRSMFIHSFPARYTHQRYLDSLDALRQSFGDRINIIDLRIPSAADSDGLMVHDESIHDGLFTYDELAAGIDRAHSKEYKVMLSATWYGAGDPSHPQYFDSYKNVVLEAAEFAYNHSVEYFCINFETKVCDDPTNNAECLDILEAVKTYVDSVPDWNPKLVHMGIENENDLATIKELTWLRSPYLDIIGYESWHRRAGVMDPTEQDMIDTWENGLTWGAEIISRTITST